MPLTASPAKSVVAPGPGQRPLLRPLALLAGGIAALAASLFYFCSRAAVPSGGDCLAQLVKVLAR
jgi:hypothetical protein